MTPLGIGIDTGGTYTDIVLLALPSQQVLKKAKTPTTHGHYETCLQQALDLLRLTPEEITALKYIVLSSTLATNALAENQLAAVGLVLEPADLQLPTLHQHELRLKSYLSYEGRDMIPLNPNEIIKGASTFADKVEAFAVAGYSATRHARHEIEIGNILTENFDKPVVLSHQLTHQMGFEKRARSSLLNAALLPVVDNWLTHFSSMLKQTKIDVPVYILSGDGSLMPVSEMKQSPLRSLLSGPSASLAGARALTNVEACHVVDVGGTTLDFGRVHEGKPRYREGGITVAGHDLAIDTLDVIPFGLGGDSRLIQGKHGPEFENRRVLPFARALEQLSDVDWSTHEKTLEEQWKYFDIELLEWLAPGELASTDPKNPEQREILNDIRLTPQPLLQYKRSKDWNAKQRDIAELIAHKHITRIAFTPTDLLTSMDEAKHSLSERQLKYIERMLDRPEGTLAQELQLVLREQVARCLLAYFLECNEHDQDHPILSKLSRNVLHPGSLMQPSFRLQTQSPLVLLGAAGHMFFEGIPLEDKMITPEHAEVACAVGAICSNFVFRDHIEIEPGRYHGADLIHRNKRESCTSLEKAVERSKELLEEMLTQKAKDWHLKIVEINHDIVQTESYISYTNESRIDWMKLSVTLRAEPE